jgi:hypothetical protein
MKAKGNDHRLLVQSKWCKIEEKKKTSLVVTGSQLGVVLD